MKHNKYINNHILIKILVLVLVFAFFILLNAFIIKMGQPIKNINQAYILSENIKNNNLNLPFPLINEYDLNTDNFDYRSSIYLKYFSKDYEEFREILNSKYYYQKGTYDCKYWSYVWVLYWKVNKERYNWDLDLITTENHVFVMVSNESGYIILDGNDQINMMG